MKGLIDEKNKEKWLEQLEKEKHDLKKECNKLEEQRSPLRERVGVLETMVGKFRKLAEQGGRQALVQQTIATKATDELTVLDETLSKWDEEWEEKDERVMFLGILVDYIRKARYLK